jgi:thioesterase domain-containing protein
VVELIVHPWAEAEIGRVVFDPADPTDTGTLLRLIAEEGQERVTHLEQPSLARLTVVRVGAETELLLTVHHAVLDGWGVRLVLGDLSIAYLAALEGSAPDFGEPPAPFRAYAHELRAAAERGDWRTSVEHWRTTLEGASACTLAADRPASRIVGAPGTTLRYEFSADAAAGARALAKAAYATPFAALLAALDIVLARGGAGTDVTIGVAAANRMSRRDQQLVGYTANLCIMRTTVGMTDTVAEVVARCRDGIWAMLTHQSAPYPEVFAALSPQTQRSLTDAAPVLFSYLGSIIDGLRLGDVELKLLRTPNRAARADLAMSVWDDGGCFAAEAEYNTARFDEHSVLKLLGDMDAVLAAATADQARTISSFVVRTRATRCGDAGAEEPSPKALPTSMLWDCIAAAWADQVGSPPTSPDADFFAAGGHSMSLVRLASVLEEETGAQIDVVDWLVQPTPRRMVALLIGDGAEGPTTASTLAWLRESTGPHLHLVHGAGGGAQDYRDLLAALPADWRVTLSQERDELKSVPEMAGRYRADLDAAELRPDLIGGWSMGGQVAFELVAGYDDPAPMLIVLDSRPPVPLDGGADNSGRWLRGFEVGACRSFGVGVGPRVDGRPELHIGVLAAYLGAAGYDVSAAALTDRWRTYERHAHAAAMHVASSTVNACALIVGAELLDVQLDQWASLVGDVRRLRVAADHHGMLTGPVANQVGAAIAALTC